MSKGFMYILKCSNSQFYTGSTKYLQERIQSHKSGEGANFTKKNLPVELVYFEEFPRIDWAFYREHQVKGWSQKKKKALIEGKIKDLETYSECMNDSVAKSVLLKRLGLQ